MGLVTIIIIAVGLAMDAFAVSIASGAAYKQLRINHIFRIAVFFGAFQAFMPVVGWLCGLGARELLAGYDHWVAFGLLAGIGVKMIYESFRIKQAEQQSDPMSVLMLVSLSVATSIDALAVGITLSFLSSSIATVALVIGLVTFLLSYLGVCIGRKVGHFFENKIEVVGGLVLIGIGTKILLEHLAFAS
jgi:putative Mn2+ efflux pump MntP